MLVGTTGMQLSEIQDDTPSYQALIVAAEQLGQAKYITRPFPHVSASLLLGAFIDMQCVGFLRLLIQVIGSDACRPPLIHAGGMLIEGYVEAFWRAARLSSAWHRSGAARARNRWLSAARMLPDSFAQPNHQP